MILHANILTTGPASCNGLKPKENSYESHQDTGQPSIMEGENNPVTLEESGK